jgi:hypothetical protein
MKVGIITIAIVSLALSAARGTTLNILEVNENLIVRFNGGEPSFVTVDHSSTDHWTITFTQGWTLNLPGGHFFTEEIGEPEGGGGPRHLENFIGLFDTTIEWDSEHETNVTGLPFFAVEPHLLLSPSGESFDIRVEDVPEPGFTLSLLRIGLAGLAWFARFRRTAT